MNLCVYGKTCPMLRQQRLRTGLFLFVTLSIELMFCFVNSLFANICSVIWLRLQLNLKTGSQHCAAHQKTKNQLSVQTGRRILRRPVPDLFSAVYNFMNCVFRKSKPLRQLFLWRSSKETFPNFSVAFLIVYSGAGLDTPFRQNFLRNDTDQIRVQSLFSERIGKGNRPSLLKGENSYNKTISET